MSTNMQHSGLTDTQVTESRRSNGSNVLTPPQSTPWWREFLLKFKDPLIVILLVAGTLSIGIAFYEYFGLDKEWKVFFEPIGIFIAILLATGLAYIFESRANRAFKILNRVNDDEPVEVIRNGAATTVPRRDIVVGDIVVINTGDEVPADGELLDAVTLSLDESSLTGEPLCHKTVDEAHFDPEATYPSNHLLRGTKVMEGHGIMRVLKVGDRTEMGGVFKEAQLDDSVKTPLNEQLDRLARWISRASYVIASLVVIVQIAHYLIVTDTYSWFEVLAHVLQTLMIAVTLIVVSVPEGLPMAVTLSLAYSMSRMLKTNNLVRKMHACETMGAATVICTDKTGTLTQNRMQVADTLFLNNPPERLIQEALAVNSTARLNGDSPLGNPTEGALLLWLKSQGVDYRKVRSEVTRIDEIPFTTERKYMATTIRRADGCEIQYIKGAPEIVCEMCGSAPEIVTDRLKTYQSQAMRTLGFAFNDGSGLKLLGIAGISDPIRPDVAAAVQEVTNAGINIKIVTGDTPGTATEIGRQIGLWNDAEDSARNIITGDEFAALSDDELRSRVQDIKIVARARPLDKKRLVEALQSLGEIVAVTGDGTNDAPALKTAHVGLSMGDGTSVAKEASDITIIDNSFSSIGRAVMWGRSLYRNIQRFLLFQLTVNVAACLLVLIGSLWGMESPLNVVQMLWINLIMDTFGAMALASLPPSPAVMKDKPRNRRASILTRPMLRELSAIGVCFFAITIAFYWVFSHAEISSLTEVFSAVLGSEKPMSHYESSLLFSIFVWTHFWYMFNARCFKTGRSVFRVAMGKGFWSIVAIIVIGQLFITELAYNFFSVAPMIHTEDWRFNPTGTLDLIIIIAGSSLVLWIRELFVTKTSPNRLTN